MIGGPPRGGAAWPAADTEIQHEDRWRFRRGTQPKAKQRKGLKDHDGWQRGYLKEGSPGLREINVWVGD